MKYEGTNYPVIGGRPHDIRCPQSGRTDINDCCKPMVAFTATNDERERCAKIVEQEWKDGGVCAVTEVVRKIREG